MKKDEQLSRRKEFVKLYLTGKYTNKEIAQKLGISVQSISLWVKEIPATQYAKIRQNLANELVGSIIQVAKRQ